MKEGQKNCPGGNRRKSHVWYSSTRESDSLRISLSVGGEGGAGMPWWMVGVTLSHHCWHVGIAGCYERLQGSLPANVYAGETLRIDPKPYTVNHTVYYTDNTNHFYFHPLAKRVFVVFLPLFIMYVGEPSILLCLLLWSFFLPTELFCLWRVVCE